MDYRKLITHARPIVERFPKAAYLYRSIRDNLRTVGDPKETPLGFKFIGNKDMEDGVFEPDETAIVKSLLQNVDVFINVGANIGYYCCLALKYGKYTVAFEPNQVNLRYLYKNVMANQKEDLVEIFPVALSNKNGIQEIYGGGTAASIIKGWSGTSERYVSLTPVSTFDKILGRRFDGKRCLIVVDIEGAERYMLEGADGMLNRIPKPIWMVEVNISEHQPRGMQINPNLLSIFTIFWEKGYKAWTADKHVRPIGVEEIKGIAQNGVDTLMTHNFLFVSRDEEIFLHDLQKNR